MANTYDFILLMDILCADCGKQMAVSNAYICEYRYLCDKCSEDIRKEIDEKYELEFGD